MRKEYDYADFDPLVCLNSLKDFFTATSGYNVVEGVITKIGSPSDIPRYDKYSYLTVKPTDENIYIIFVNYAIYKSDIYDYEPYKGIFMLVSNTYDSNVYPWMNVGLLHNGKYYTNKTDYTYQGNYEPTVNYYYYLPAPALNNITKLVCNYNDDGRDVLISGVKYTKVKYEAYEDERTETYNICFGDVKKFLTYVGGFYYGGDYYTTIEIYHRVKHDYNSVNYRYYTSALRMLSGASTIGADSHKGSRKIGNTYRIVWSDNTSTDLSLHGTGFFFNLLISVDNAEGRDKRKLSEIEGDTSQKIIDNSGIPIYLTDSMFDLNIRNIWATTINVPYYMNMHTTFESEYHYLPTFWTEVTNNSVGLGHTVGTLSKISLFMPLHFYVRRDPLEEELYSQAGEARNIKYVNMLHMSTNHIDKNSFPVPNSKYNCFNSGHRRNSHGYNGVAIKMEDD